MKSAARRTRSRTTWRRPALGTANVCGCTAATTCPGGQNCGTASNGCGGTLNCGIHTRLAFEKKVVPCQKLELLASGEDEARVAAGDVIARIRQVTGARAGAKPDGKKHDTAA